MEMTQFYNQPRVAIHGTALCHFFLLHPFRLVLPEHHDTVYTGYLKHLPILLHLIVMISCHSAEAMMCLLNNK